MPRWVANWMNLSFLLAIIQKKYGFRNENGDRLAQFAASNDLFLVTFHDTSRLCMELSLIETLNGTKTIIIKLTIVLCQLVDKQILLNVPPEVKSPELIIVL
jgi:hypothetical protein